MRRHSPPLPIGRQRDCRHRNEAGQCGSRRSTRARPSRMQRRVPSRSAPSASAYGSSEGAANASVRHGHQPELDGYGGLRARAVVERFADLMLARSRSARAHWRVPAAPANFGVPVQQNASAVAHVGTWKFPQDASAVGQGLATQVTGPSDAKEGTTTTPSRVTPHGQCRAEQHRIDLDHRQRFGAMRGEAYRLGRHRPGHLPAGARFCASAALRMRPSPTAPTRRSTNSKVRSQPTAAPMRTQPSSARRGVGMRRSARTRPPPPVPGERPAPSSAIITPSGPITIAANAVANATNGSANATAEVEGGSDQARPAPQIARSYRRAMRLMPPSRSARARAPAGQTDCPIYASIETAISQVATSTLTAELTRTGAISVEANA